MINKKSSVLVFGDSHTVYFGKARQVIGYNNDYNDINIDCHVKHGAAIAGFGKRKSTMNVRQQLINTLDKSNYDFLVLNFGQVDIELGLFYRKFIKGENITFEEHVENIINVYINFISTLPFDKSSILVKGLNLPALCYSRSKWLEYINRIITENVSDPDEIKKIEREMQDNYCDDITRTKMSLIFNRKLEFALKHIDVEYCDINNKIQDKSTGMISLDYIPCKLDHHLVDSVGVRNYHRDLIINFIVDKLSLRVLF